MTPYIDSWKKNKLTFDGISTGFLGSVRQIDMVLDFLRDFKGPDTKVIVDPVMGDNGRIYSSYTQEMCDDMRRLLADADVLTPNLTEACELLGRPYRPSCDLSDEDFSDMAKALADKGPQGVVLTGIHRGSYIGNFIYDHGRSRGSRRRKSAATAAGRATSLRPSSRRRSFAEKALKKPYRRRPTSSARSWNIRRPSIFRTTPALLLKNI